MNANATRMKSEPAPSWRTAPAPAAAPRSDHNGANTDVDADIAAEVEKQLAAQRAELTAKLVAERAEQRRKAAMTEEAARKAAAAAAAKKALASPAAALAIGSEFAPEDIERLQRMLAAAGVKLVAAAPVRRVAIANDDSDTGDVPDADYSDTERVQVELSALLDLMGVVCVKDVQEHVLRDDGAVMSPSNVRYHMKKLANRGAVKKVEQRYKLPGLGWRTRDVWSKDSQKLLEVLEGKKTVRS